MCVHMPGSTQDNSPIQDAAQAGFPGLLGRGGGAARMCLLLTFPSREEKEDGIHTPFQPLHFPTVVFSQPPLLLGMPSHRDTCKGRSVQASLMELQPF